jgi:hypothetical protein
LGMGGCGRSEWLGVVAVQFNNNTLVLCGYFLFPETFGHLVRWNACTWLVVFFYLAHFYVSVVVWAALAARVWVGWGGCT